jgi:hypothetical protein
VQEQSSVSSVSLDVPDHVVVVEVIL